MNQDWRDFWQKFWRGLKFNVLAIALVPVIHVILDFEISRPDYLQGLLQSLRIGTEVSFFYTLGVSAFWAVTIFTKTNILKEWQKNRRGHTILSLTIIFIAISLAAFIEPFISGENFGPRGLAVSGLFSGLIFLVISSVVAYRELEKKYLQARTNTAESNYNVLKLQMQPHFLFNSLNSLSALIEENKHWYIYPR